MAQTLDHIADVLPVILRIGFGLVCVGWLLAIIAFLRPLWGRP